MDDALTMCLSARRNSKEGAETSHWHKLKTKVSRTVDITDILGKESYYVSQMALNNFVVWKYIKFVCRLLLNYNWNKIYCMRSIYVKNIPRNTY